MTSILPKATRALKRIEEIEEKLSNPKITQIDTIILLEEQLKLIRSLCKGEGK